MKTEYHGKVVKGLGGLYEVRCASDGKVERLTCRAKGILKRGEEKLLIGDTVTVTVDDAMPDDTVISAIAPRKNELIRPPLSNLDILFLTFAAAKPDPVLETVDKMTAIARHHSITPVIIVTKCDLDPARAAEYRDIYERSGFTVFLTSSETGEGIRELSAFLGKTLCGGVTAAFAGASGVGKSTLMNALFPSLGLATGEISHKIERGKHTTRHVEIFAIDGDRADAGFLADTPGFSLIDFEHFDFFSLDELEINFPDIASRRGGCRYADCAHIGEGTAECAVARAVENGEIAPSRLSSYRAIYRTLKNKNTYK